MKTSNDQATSQEVRQGQSIERLLADTLSVAPACRTTSRKAFSLALHSLMPDAVKCKDYIATFTEAPALGSAQCNVVSHPHRSAGAFVCSVLSCVLPWQEAVFRQSPQTLSSTVLVHDAPCCPMMSFLQRRFGLPTHLTPPPPPPSLF